MDLNQIISDIQQSECVNCRFGKALIALRDLRDSDVDDSVTIVSTSEPAKALSSAQADRSRRNKTVARSYPVSDGKKKCNKCGRVQPLDQFTPHKQCAGGRQGTCRDCVKARVNALIEARRKAANKTNSPGAGGSGSAHSLAQDLKCKMCNAPCSSEARLASHMRVVHGAAAI